MTTIHSALTHCPKVENLDVYLEVGGCTGSEQIDETSFPNLEKSIRSTNAELACDTTIVPEALKPFR